VTAFLVGALQNVIWAVAAMSRGRGMEERGGGENFKESEGKYDLKHFILVANMLAPKPAGDNAAIRFTLATSTLQQISQSFSIDICE